MRRGGCHLKSRSHTPGASHLSTTYVWQARTCERDPTDPRAIFKTDDRHCRHGHRPCDDRTVRLPAPAPPGGSDGQPSRHGQDALCDETIGTASHQRCTLSIDGARDRIFFCPLAATNSAACNQMSLMCGVRTALVGGSSRRHGRGGDTFYCRLLRRAVQAVQGQPLRACLLPLLCWHGLLSRIRVFSWMRRSANLVRHAHRICLNSSNRLHRWSRSSK